MKRCVGQVALYGSLVLMCVLGVHGCSADITVNPTCLEGSCPDGVPIGGGDGGMDDSDNTMGDADTTMDDPDTSVEDEDTMVADTDTDGMMDTTDDADTSLGNCLEALGYCPVQMACTDSCASVVGVWPPPEENARTVRDGDLIGSVNVQSFANFLFAAFVAWPEQRNSPQPWILRLFPDYRANPLEPFIDAAFTTDATALDVFYEAPAMELLERSGNPRQVKLIVPFVGFESDQTLLRHAEFNITDDDFGFELLNGSDGLENVTKPRRIFQPALFPFTNQAAEGELWTGWQHQGQMELWRYRDNNLSAFLEKVRTEDAVEGCIEVTGSRTSSVTLFSAEEGDPAFMECYTGPDDMSTFHTFDDRRNNNTPANAVAEVWLGSALSPVVVYGGPDPFMARVVLDPSTLKPALQVVRNLFASEPVSTVSGMLGDMVDRVVLNAGVELSMCPSSIDGIALADLDGDDFPEISVLVRLAEDCALDASSAPEQRSFLIHYRLNDGQVEEFSEDDQASSDIFRSTLVGPLVADVDNDGDQEFIVGVLGDRRQARLGNNDLYAVQYIDSEGLLNDFDGLSKQVVDIPEDPQSLHNSPFFELPIAVGDLRQGEVGLELLVLRMYGQGANSALRTARLVMYSISDTAPSQPPQWPMRLGNGGQTGIWLPSNSP